MHSSGTYKDSLTNKVPGEPWAERIRSLHGQRFDEINEAKRPVEKYEWSTTNAYTAVTFSPAASSLMMASNSSPFEAKSIRTKPHYTHDQMRGNQSPERTIDWVR